MPFDVVGDELEGDELEGDVMGDVMGDDVVGLVQRNPRTGRHQIVRVQPKRIVRAPARKPSNSNAIQLGAKPSWRKQQVAPGVIRPEEGMVPLPMTPLSNGGVFSSTSTNITWQGQLQKPFRAERLLVSTVRTGASAVGRVLGQNFVGTDLQQAEIEPFDIELVGQAGSFGTRLTCAPAAPGVILRLQCFLSTPLTSTDTIFVSIMWLGRVIH